MSTSVGAGVSEREFQSAVLELAGWCGWRCYHTYDSRRSEAGFPDLVMVRDGRLVVAELKSERGRVSAEQQGWLEAFGLVAAGSAGRVRVCVWRPADWAAIVEVLARREVVAL